MIFPTNDKILVRVDMSQKDTMTLNGVTVSTAILFEKNYREKSPVVACVVEGNEWVKENDILLCHHNLFYDPSPHYLYDDLFTIPANKLLFAVVGSKGLTPIYGNILCERVDKPSLLLVPEERREKYTDRVKVVNGGYTPYKPGDLLFTRPYSFYEIVYILNGIERRIHKCHEDMVCGILRK